MGKIIKFPGSYNGNCIKGFIGSISNTYAACIGLGRYIDKKKRVSSGNNEDRFSVIELSKKKLAKVIRLEDFKNYCFSKKEKRGYSGN